jgi:hypothetical protein
VVKREIFLTELIDYVESDDLVRRSKMRQFTDSLVQTFHGEGVADSLAFLDLTEGQEEMMYIVEKGLEQIIYNKMRSEIEVNLILRDEYMAWVNHELNNDAIILAGGGYGRSIDTKKLAAEDASFQRLINFLNNNLVEKQQAKRDFLGMYFELLEASDSVN